MSDRINSPWPSLPIRLWAAIVLGFWGAADDARAGVSVSINSFGSGGNAFEIEFVTVGDPNNAADTEVMLCCDVTTGSTGYGSVPYGYRMGKYEVSEGMINKANALGGLGITHDNRGANKPVTSVTWYEAARFVNWLNTSTGNVPAYKFVGSNFQHWAPTDPGYDPNNLYRNTLEKYFLPSTQEWYKAAYYDPAAGAYYDYATGSDALPDGIDFAGDPIFDAVFNQGGESAAPNDISNVGMLSPYGTAGQTGNVFEWEETDSDLVNDSHVPGHPANPTTPFRGTRGGGWGTSSTSAMMSSSRRDAPAAGSDNVNGFRVASVVPEPSSWAVAATALALLAKRRSKPSNRSHARRRLAFDRLEQRRVMAVDFASAFAVGGIANENVYDLALDDAGNTCLVGGFTGTVDFDPSEGVHELTGGGTYAAKYDPSGRLVWAQRIGPSNSCFTSARRSPRGPTAPSTSSAPLPARRSSAPLP